VSPDLIRNDFLNSPHDIISGLFEAIVKDNKLLYESVVLISKCNDFYYRVVGSTQGSLFPGSMPIDKWKAKLSAINIDISRHYVVPRKSGNRIIIYRFRVGVSEFSDGIYLTKYVCHIQKSNNELCALTSQEEEFIDFKSPDKRDEILIVLKMAGANKVAGANR